MHCCVWLSTYIIYFNIIVFWAWAWKNYVHHIAWGEQRLWCTNIVKQVTETFELIQLINWSCSSLTSHALRRPSTVSVVMPSTSACTQRHITSTVLTLTSDYLPVGQPVNCGITAAVPNCPECQNLLLNLKTFTEPNTRRTVLSVSNDWEKTRNDYR